MCTHMCTHIYMSTEGAVGRVPEIEIGVAKCILWTHKSTYFQKVPYICTHMHYLAKLRFLRWYRTFWVLFCCVRCKTVFWSQLLTELRISFFRVREFARSWFIYTSYMYRFVCRCIYVYMYICVYVYMCIYIYVYTYIYIYMCISI